jgi:hypothetical protein
VLQVSIHPNLQRSPAWRRIAAAAMIGLAAGLFLGGAYLLFEGGTMILGGFACGGQSEQQCSLDREIARHLARQQVLAGGALALLALAIAMWLRGKLNLGSGPPREGA